MSVVTTDLGQCWFCGTLFEFDMSTVDIIVIDPQTGYPPDYNPESKLYDRPITEDMLDRCERMPFCPTCKVRLRESE